MSETKQTVIVVEEDDLVGIRQLSEEGVQAEEAYKKAYDAYTEIMNNLQGRQQVIWKALAEKYSLDLEHGAYQLDAINGVICVLDPSKLPPRDIELKGTEAVPV